MRAPTPPPPSAGSQAEPPPAPSPAAGLACPECGAELRFDPLHGGLSCEHCGHTEEIAQSGPWAASIRELDFETARAGSREEPEVEESRTLDCPNCGAEVEFEDLTQARECPFCATPMVTGTSTGRRIGPRALLPFALDERAARKAMTDWLGRLWFAPGGLQAYARKGRKLQGIYVPYWTFDADTESRYRGERGTVYHETRQVTRNGKPATVQVARVRWRPVSGRVARFFDDLLVLASRTLPKRHTDALAPWDLSALEPYRPEYLAGFGAERYQVSLEDGFAEARAQMDRRIARDVRFDIGGDRQRIHQIDTVVRDVTFKHILLPVWVAAYRYRGETYRFVVNGHSGRVQGERPWSVIKIAVAVLLGLTLAAAAGYLMALQKGAI